MSTIANSTIKLSLDSTSVQRGVDGINKKFAGMGTAVKAGFAAMGAASLAYFKGFVDRMGEVADMATRLGITTDEVQRIGLVAKQSGTDVDTVAKAMERFSINLIKAGEGGEAAMKGLARLNITADEFISLSVDQKLLKLSEAYSSSNKGAQELAGLMALLGKQGAELIPLLTLGPDALRKSLEGVNVVSEQTVANMEQIGDEMDRVKQEVDYGFGIVITKVWKHFNHFIDGVVSGLAVVAKMAEAQMASNPETKKHLMAAAYEMQLAGVEAREEYMKPPPTRTDKMREDLAALTAQYEAIKRDPMAGKASGDLFMAIKKLTAAIERQNSPAFPQ